MRVTVGPAYRPWGRTGRGRHGRDEDGGISWDTPRTRRTRGDSHLNSPRLPGVVLPLLPPPRHSRIRRTYRARGRDAARPPRAPPLDRPPGLRRRAIGPGSPQVAPGVLSPKWRSRALYVLPPASLQNSSDINQRSHPVAPVSPPHPEPRGQRRSARGGCAAGISVPQRAWRSVLVGMAVTLVRPPRFRARSATSTSVRFGSRRLSAAARKSRKSGCAWSAST